MKRIESYVPTWTDITDISVAAGIALFRVGYIDPAVYNISFEVMEDSVGVKIEVADIASDRSVLVSSSEEYKGCKELVNRVKCLKDRCKEIGYEVSALTFDCKQDVVYIGKLVRVEAKPTNIKLFESK